MRKLILLCIFLCGCNEHIPQYCACPYKTYPNQAVGSGTITTDYSRSSDMAKYPVAKK